MTGPTLLVALGSLVPIAYLAGSVPFGLLIGKAKGVDVRTAGSKNIGASNVGRLLGRKFFWIVFLLDAAKALVPTMIATGLVHSSRQTPTSAVYALWMAVALAGIVGHMFSLFLGFKGGKGVATTAGALLGVWPYLTLPCVAMVIVYAALFFTTRYISLGSMGGAITFPVSYIAIGLARGWGPFGAQWPFTAFSLLVPTLVLWKHRTNIGRLLAGTENRAGKRD